jgi:hypothetical protein
MRHPETNKQHQHALENLQTRQALDNLKHEWPALDYFHKAIGLLALWQAGCTKKGLAKDFNCSELLIHFLVLMVDMPLDELAEIEAFLNPYPPVALTGNGIVAWMFSR